MEAIILCAGYATRLYPLTKDKPKPLLKINGIPIIERIAGKIKEINGISGINVVTNDRFYGQFIEWRNNFKANKPLAILNDGTTSNENRLGAVGDINFALSQKNIKDDALIIAGDNLFDLDLQDALEEFKRKRSNIIVLHDVKDRSLARNYGVVEVDREGIVRKFEEKPKNPKSTLVSTGIYIFPKETLGRIREYASQNNADKIGTFLELLHKTDSIYSHISEKAWFDIGSHEQLKKAEEHYKKSDMGKLRCQMS